MILQRIRIIVGDVGFELGTYAPEHLQTNEPPHLLCLWYALQWQLMYMKLNGTVDR